MPKTSPRRWCCGGGKGGRRAARGGTRVCRRRRVGSAHAVSRPARPRSCRERRPERRRAADPRPRCCAQDGRMAEKRASTRLWCPAMRCEVGRWRTYLEFRAADSLRDAIRVLVHCLRWQEGRGTARKPVFVRQTKVQSPFGPRTAVYMPARLHTTSAPAVSPIRCADGRMGEGGAL